MKQQRVMREKQLSSETFRFLDGGERSIEGDERAVNLRVPFADLQPDLVEFESIAAWRDGFERGENGANGRHAQHFAQSSYIKREAEALSPRPVERLLAL
jgi:hypothetical protein